MWRHVHMGASLSWLALFRGVALHPAAHASGIFMPLETWRQSRLHSRFGNERMHMLEQASAKADVVERAETQSQTLEGLLEIFFRVLKQCTASGLLSGAHTGECQASYSQRQSCPACLGEWVGLVSERAVL